MLAEGAGVAHMTFAEGAHVAHLAAAMAAARLPARRSRPLGQRAHHGADIAEAALCG